MRKLFNSLTTMVLVFCLFSTDHALAEVPATSAIKSIQSQMDGGRLLLKLQFDKPLSAPPGNWSTAEPARIVFDFPDTQNQTGKNSQIINAGDLRSINVVQTENLTRMVLNLHRSTGYSVTVKGTELYISLEPFKSAKLEPAAVSRLVAEAKVPINEPALVRDLTFRRGGEGQAQILVDLSDGSVPLDIQRDSTGLTVGLQNTEVPERLLSKRDVNDFATPVSSITTSTNGSRALIKVLAKGRWSHHAQMVNNQLVIEVKQLTIDETNRLVPVGGEGKKISINFYDAELPMILRTLAELSGKNVIIDDSLKGRKVTAIKLDNMPYDQALEVVMSQTGTAMRVREGLVLFGAREVLLKRDSDMADELARANEVSQLIAETFSPNYVQVADLEKLIRKAVSPTTVTSTSSAVVAASAGAAATGQGSDGNASTNANGSADRSATIGRSQGLLSPRGVMSIHETTNKLFVKDTQVVVDQIRKIIAEIDVPPKQVMIEARIVEAASDFQRNLGVRLNYFDSRTLKNSSVGTYSTADGSKSSTKAFGTSYSLSGTTAASLSLFNTAATRILTMEIQASEVDNKSKTISSPRVVTQNRKVATINNTQQVMVQTGVAQATNSPIYTSLTATLSLNVTPSITPDGKVNLDLTINRGSLNVASLGTNTNTLTTNVMVENGGTVVIGGINIDSETNNQERVPVLGDLPYVGFLFKTTTKLRNKSELLVFITPRIMNEHMALR